MVFPVGYKDCVSVVLTVFQHTDIVNGPTWKTIYLFMLVDINL